MSSIMSLFKVIILMQLFYAFSITLLLHVSPVSPDYIDSVSSGGLVDMDSVSGDIQDSVTSQLNIPVVEIGALVFYSGNILLDLLLNFFFAIPQMIGFLVTGFCFLFNLNNYLVGQIELFAGVIVTVFYFIGLIQLLIGIRSGQAGVI